MKIIKSEHRRHFIVISILIVLVSILVFGTLTGCQEKVNDKAGEGTLTVFYRYNDPVVSYAIGEFRRQYPGVEIILDEWERADYDVEKVIFQKLNMDLMSGEGPDVITFSSGVFRNANKVISTDVFMDLNPFIDEDNEFDLSEYNEPVFNSGIYNKKLQ